MGSNHYAVRVDSIVSAGIGWRKELAFSQSNVMDEMSRMSQMIKVNLNVELRGKKRIYILGETNPIDDSARRL